MLRDRDRKPNFHFFERMLERQPTPRPVMFDFIIGEEKTKLLIGDDYADDTEFDRAVSVVKAFDSGGYDFAPIIVRGLDFQRSDADDSHETKSLNQGSLIVDRPSYDSYEWPDINDCDFSFLSRVGEYLPAGAKFIPFSFDGILENTIGLVGYERLCYLSFDDKELLGDIFREVGKRMEQYFHHCLQYDEVGAILCNDDWGFNSQTMLPPDILRKHVFPWYKRIVKMAHDKGKYAILHSCGYYGDIIDDVIEDMGFDGRHSYEDKIVPVEEAYEALHPRLAVLGGIDVNFLARATADEVHERAVKLLDRTFTRGGYALGSGNSIPDYIPNDNYIALLKACLDYDGRDTHG